MSQVTDISSQVTTTRQELCHALTELESGQASPFNVDSSKAVSKDEAVASLTEYLNSHQELKAIQILRSFRSVHVFLSICLSACLSICLCACLSVCLTEYLNSHQELKIVRILRSFQSVPVYLSVSLSQWVSELSPRAEDHTDPEVSLVSTSLSVSLSRWVPELSPRAEHHTDPEVFLVITCLSVHLSQCLSVRLTD